jgi:predicted metal-dependent hydrolase
MVKMIRKDNAVCLQYRLVRSRRKTLSLIIHEDQSLEVRCPQKLPRAQIDQFVREKAGWIERKRSESSQARQIGPLQPDMHRLAGTALAQDVKNALAHFEGPQPAKVLIRDLSSRWGSCSSKGTVSLNSRCYSLPLDLREYVIYHELCHLVFLNHGAQFWNLLHGYLPDARRRQRRLNQFFRLQSR